jgi:geranylgeranyl diphosphate synthase type II
MIEAINRCLESLIPEKQVAHNPLFQAARYSLLSSGKRIRPLFTLETGKLFGAPQDDLLIPACALELIHTYSLIHDDLPALDNDDMRRGKPSLHKAFDEATAILAGDFLLTYAFEILATAALPEKTRLSLITCLATASGSEGMIGGQLLDVSHANVSSKEINAKKTGALFRASIEFGGIVANVSPALLNRLRIFGDAVGAQFQLCDDILDGDSAPGAYQEAKERHEEIIHLLSQLPGDSRPLKTLTEMILHQVSL